MYLFALPLKKADYVAAKLERYFGLVGYPNIFLTGTYSIVIQFNTFKMWLWCKSPSNCILVHSPIIRQWQGIHCQGCSWDDAGAQSQLFHCHWPSTVQELHETKGQLRAPTSWFTVFWKVSRQNVDCGPLMWTGLIFLGRWCQCAIATQVRRSIVFSYEAVFGQRFHPQLKQHSGNAPMQVHFPTAKVKSRRARDLVRLWE